MKFAFKIIRLLAAVALLAMGLARCARAQSSDEEDDRQSECRRATGSERRRCENEIGVPGWAMPVADVSGRLAPRGEIRLQLALIGEDLNYLESAGQRLSLTASRGGALDLKAVGKTASEVARRAGRLQDSLALPNPKQGAREREERAITNPGQLREALSALSALMADAVRNPVLKGYLLEPEMSDKAWRDLDEIVELSGRVKAGSRMLVKDGR